MSLPLKIHTPGPKDDKPFVSNQPTVAQVIDWYEANPSRQSHSDVAEQERRRLWGLFRSKFGARLVADVKAFELLGFINGQKGVKSDWSRKRWNATIQRPFNVAKKLQLIPQNPFEGLSFPTGINGRDWTDAEYRALLRHSVPYLRRVLIAIRYSGMRPGEVCQLRFRDVDMRGRRIVIEKHKTRHLTKRPRYVPLNNALAKLIAFCQGHNARHATPDHAQYVFLNSKMQRIEMQAVQKSLRRLRVRIDLPAGVKLHGGRHTFATRAIMNGVGVPSLMEILGHRQVYTTQRYTHLTNKVDHLAGAMEQAIAPAAPPAPVPARKNRS